VKKLQLLTQIRNRLIDGASHGTLQEEFGLNKRTYFRYVRKIFEDDRKVLQEKNQEELERQLVILHERYFFILGELKRIATDQNQTAQDQMQALHSMASLSLTISKLFGDSPAIAALQLRKLKALKEGPISFLREGFVIPSSSAYTANRYILGGRARPLEEELSSTQPPQPEEDQSKSEEDY
jgi:hypothetical protein